VRLDAFRIKFDRCGELLNRPLVHSPFTVERAQIETRRRAVGVELNRFSKQLYRGLAFALQI